MGSGVDIARRVQEPTLRTVNCTFNCAEVHLRHGQTETTGAGEEGGSTALIHFPASPVISFGPLFRYILIYDSLLTLLCCQVYLVYNDVNFNYDIEAGA